jgi:hypothetical protein
MQGQSGPQGPTGSINSSAITTVIGPTAEVGPATEKGVIGSADAVCPTGDRAVSGGGYGGINGILDSEMESSHRSWFVIIDNRLSVTAKIHATVECAAAGQAVAARFPSATHALLDERLAKLRAEAEAQRSVETAAGK